MLPRPRWGLPLLLAPLLGPRHGGAAAVDIAAWEFETDPHDVGAAERWFSAQACSSGSSCGQNQWDVPCHLPQLLSDDAGHVVQCRFNMMMILFLL